MDFLNRYWTTIRAQLEGVSAQTKFLIGSLLVILLLVGFIAALYAGRATMQPINYLSDASPEEIVSKLTAAGISAEVTNGQVMVGSRDFNDAVARLAQDSMLSANAYRAFDQIADSPWNSEATNKRAYTKAKMKLVSDIARRMEGVASADVIIDPPQNRGFGGNFTRPTGSVTVRMKGDVPVNKKLATALADLVSSSMAEMRREDVKVIDGTTGQSIPVSSEDEFLPGDVLELVDAEERRLRNKIETVLLGTGAMVAVNVTLDRTQREAVESVQYEKSEPLLRQSTSERTRVNQSTASEAGVRSNTQLTIETGGGDTSSETETTVESEFGDKRATEKSSKQIAGHGVKQVNVAINVPRGYYAGIFRLANPPADDGTITEPSDADLQPIIDREQQRITMQVEGLLTQTPSKVNVAMVYDPALLSPSVAGGSVIDSVIQGPWSGTIMVAGLGVGAMMLMLMMVRRAARQDPLPSIEELAGLPAQLPTDDELIGEAGDVESTMTGVELNEAELRSRKIAEQISDLIKTNPMEVGSLLGKWVDAGN
jgi:flagellar biosynthesis/type III secretory pathway M-ring protein FliF/YscJ